MKKNLTHYQKDDIVIKVKMNTILRQVEAPASHLVDVHQYS